MISLSIAESDNILRPKITVWGVGGAGSNAVNNMIRSQLEGCDFVAANTDAQALASSLAPRKIQLGITQTRGLGAGSKPEVGRAAAEEQLDDIRACLEQTDMVFVTAGMGGGTGTGAAPIIARVARDLGILTVGVVTKPFDFEGNRRRVLAEQGLAELQQYVDTLIIIPNQNLFRLANERTTFAEAFRMADEVLHCGVRGITDLMVMPGFMNLDFADVKTVMGEMGKAMMGTGEASGENRALRAAESAISNPLLEDTSMKGAKGVLINITGGMDMTLFEVDQAANRIREEVDPDAQIKVGSTLSDNLEGTIRVSVIATGIEALAASRAGQSSHVGTASTSGTGSFRGTQPPKLAPTSQPPAAQPAATAPAAPQSFPSTPPSPPRSLEAMREFAPQASTPPAFTVQAQNTEVQNTPPASPSTAELSAPPPPQTHSFIPRFQPPPPLTPDQPSSVMPASPNNAVQSNVQHASTGVSSAGQSLQQSATQPLRGQQIGGQFVAPKPAEAVRQPQFSHQQAASKFTPQQQQSAPTSPPATSTSHHDEAHGQNRNARRAESLFTRITGFGLVRPSSEQKPQPAPPPLQQRLNIDPNDRAPASANSDEDDILEIPAFLRRQTNH